MQWYRFAELAPTRLYELLAFRQAIFVVEQRSPYPDLDFLDQFALHLLLPAEGALAGYLRLLPSGDHRPVKLGRVAVAGPRRGEGLGRRLIGEALRRCGADYPGRPVALSAQSYLVPLYRSFGFAVTSAPYDDYGVRHVDMLKEG